MYLNGLNSGTMPSHAALAKAGKIAGKPARPAKRATRVIPTIGEINTRRSGRDNFSSLMESSAYIKASAPPLEKPTRCNGADGSVRAACFAHREPRRRHPVLPLHVGQRGRNGAMRRHPRHDSHKPLIAIETLRYGADCKGNPSGHAEARQHRPAFPLARAQRND